MTRWSARSRRSTRSRHRAGRSRRAPSRGRRRRCRCGRGSGAAPPGPVQSPGSTIRSSTRTPSEVVVPTWRPARSRTWVISRVTVLLPLVPRDRHDRDAADRRRAATRAASRAPPAIRSVQRARSRSWAPVSRAVRDGETSRSASASAASVRVSARSAPTHGKVTIQWPGSDERWTARPPRPRHGRRAGGGSRPTVAATPSGQSRVGTAAPEMDERVATGIALPVPGPPPADGDLELDHRLEPVDVRAFEEAGLDQTHGPGRIARCQPLDWADDRLDRDAPDPVGRRARRTAQRWSVPTSRPTWSTWRASSTSTAGATRRPASTRSGAGWRHSSPTWAPRSSTGPTPTAAWATRCVATFHGRADGPRILLIGHMDTVFDPGTAAERPFRIDDGIAYGPGVTDMKAGLLAGLLRAQGDHRRARRRCRSSGSSSSPIRTRRSARRARPRTSARWQPTATSRSCSNARAPTATSCRPARGSSTCGSSSTGAPRMPGSSRRRVAARSSRRPGSSASSTTLNGRWPDVTVNVGVIAGGTRPERRRRALLARGRPPGHDTRRARDGRGRDPAHRRGDRGRPTRPSATSRWPAGGRWRSSSGAAGWSSTPRLSPSALGFEIADASTGGASDANTTAGLGIPSLDGLGPIGGNDHSPTEYLDVDSIVPRTTLLAGLLLAIAGDPEVAAWRAGADGADLADDAAAR